MSISLSLSLYIYIYMHLSKTVWPSFALLNVFPPMPISLTDEFRSAQVRAYDDRA